MSIFRSIIICLARSLCPVLTALGFWQLMYDFGKEYVLNVFISKGGERLPRPSALVLINVLLPVIYCSLWRIFQKFKIKFPLIIRSKISILKFKKSYLGRRPGSPKTDALTLDTLLPNRLKDQFCFRTIDTITSLEFLRSEHYGDKQ